MELVVREVDQPFDAESAPLRQFGQQFRTPLEAAVRREHRIEHSRTVGVQADPVVRKQRVGTGPIGAVGERVDFDAGLEECIGQTVELGQRP